jgi:RHS repeat-associated protein
LFFGEFPLSHNSFLKLQNSNQRRDIECGILGNMSESAALTAQYGESFRPAYGYDAAGRRTSMSTRDYNAAYTYDDLDRLTAAAYSAFQDKPGGTITHAMIPDEDFTYDKNGNRTALLKDPGPGQGEDVSVSYTHDSPVNRLTSDGAWTYLFDHNGNVVRKRSIADPDHLYDDFHYNFQNKLVRHVAHRPGISASGITTEYAYDPLGRRILKLTTRVGNPSAAQQFAYDGDDARLDFATTYDTADNTYKTKLTARYTNGPGVDQPLAIWHDTDGDNALEPYFYHADALGSITAITAAASGDITAKYAYDAFGNLAQKCGAPASPGRTALVDYNRYRYTSREWDGETRLYYYRDRMYDSNIGIFYSEDSKWKINPYSYALNNPLMFIDPYGLDELPMPLVPELNALELDFDSIKSSLRDTFDVKQLSKLLEAELGFKLPLKLVTKIAIAIAFASGIDAAISNNTRKGFDVPSRAQIAFDCAIVSSSPIPINEKGEFQINGDIILQSVFMKGAQSFHLEALKAAKGTMIGIDFVGTFAGAAFNTCACYISVYTVPWPQSK